MTPVLPQPALKQKTTVARALVERELTMVGKFLSRLRREEMKLFKSYHVPEHLCHATGIGDFTREFPEPLFTNNFKEILCLAKCFSEFQVKVLAAFA